MNENEIRHPKSVFSKIGTAVFIYILAVNLLAIIASGICMVFFYEFATSPYYNWVMTAVVQYGIGLPIVFIILRKLPNYRYESQKISTKNLLGCFTLISACGYIGSILGNMVNNFFAGVLGKEIKDPLNETLLESPLWLSFLVVVIIGPVVEEFIFRRLIIDKIRPYGEMLAVIFSGLVFGAFHGNFSQFFYASAIGMVLAYVYLRTMKLLYPALLHVAFNFVFGFIPLVMQIYFPLSDEALQRPSVTDLPSILVNSAFTLVVITLSIFGIIFFFVKRKKITFYSNYYEIPKRSRFKFAVLNGGMITFSIICLVEFILYLFI